MSPNELILIKRIINLEEITMGKRTASRVGRHDAYRDPVTYNPEQLEISIGRKYPKRLDMYGYYTYIV